VQHREAGVEPLLRCGAAGYGEVDLSELRGISLFVLVPGVGGRPGGESEKENGDRSERPETLHGYALRKLSILLWPTSGKIDHFRSYEVPS
jgi:hypothetical protein